MQFEVRSEYLELRKTFLDKIELCDNYIKKVYGACKVRASLATKLYRLILRGSKRAKQR